MKHIVSLSGGVSSAVAADRVIQRYGKHDTLLWFADTLWEDEDLYRFLDDCAERWGIEVVKHVEGRTPLMVAEDENIIPNQRVAPCTLRLKIKPFREFIGNLPKPITVHLGLGWDETHRMDAPKRNYEALEGVTVNYPLMWKPWCWDTFAEVRSWGIEIPRLYGMGFPHNNCGGRCVKQGIKEWQRLSVAMPERFAEVRDWEQHQRSLGGNKENYAICRDSRGGEMKPLTLLEIEQRDAPKPGEPVQEDMFSCFCSYG